MKTLAFDLDGKNGLDNFLRRRCVMKYMGLKVGNPNMELYESPDPKIRARYEGIPVVPVRLWDTMNGWHLEIDLDNDIDDIKAIFMQTSLGSDYRREVCNLLRIERDCEKWNSLFKRKFKVNELGQRIQVSEERFDAETSQKVQDLLELGE